MSSPAIIYARRLRLLLSLELLLIFFGMPLFYYLGLVTIPAIPALLGLALICLIVLWYDTGFHFTDELNFHLPPGKTGLIIVRFLILGSLLALAVWRVFPDRFLDMPLNNTAFWLLLMVVYPVFSAFPQELIYRSFLFHRYKLVLQNRWVMMGFSVIAFAFLHIIYENWIAIVLTLAGGYLFTKTYIDTGSIWLTTLEHTMYGCLIFTLGLGSFFYIG